MRDPEAGSTSALLRLPSPFSDITEWNVSINFYVRGESSPLCCDGAFSSISLAPKSVFNSLYFGGADYPRALLWSSFMTTYFFSGMSGASVTSMTLLGA